MDYLMKESPISKSLLRSLLDNGIVGIPEPIMPA